MAYEISIRVTKSGELESSQSPLRLSVYRESKRVKLRFQVDPEIDSAYHYLKLTHAKVAYLYRVHDNEFEIPKAVTAYEGRWEISFIACDEPANSDSTITANYIYASEPITADVAKGNLGIIRTSEESKLLSELAEGTFERFEIPSGVEYIATNFLAMAENQFEVAVPYTVRQIKKYAFYESGCTAIKFEQGSELATLEDYALYRIANLGSIRFPNSLSSWGRYNLSGCGCERVEFESNSKLTSLTSYAFWSLPGVKKIYLPDRLSSFTGGTSVIKGCPLLEEVWFPNTISAPIPQNAINEDCAALTKITLQSNFNASANFSNAANLTKESLVAMLRALKDLTGAGSKVLAVGEANLAKLTDEEKAIALDKNWSLA